MKTLTSASAELSDKIDRIPRGCHWFAYLRSQEDIATDSLATGSTRTYRRQLALTALKPEALHKGRACAIEEYFRRYRMHVDPDSARVFFDGCYAWAVRSRLPPMRAKAQMLNKQFAGLLSYAQQRIIGVMSEGFNRGIQDLKAAAREFCKFKNYRTRSASGYEVAIRTQTRSYDTMRQCLLVLKQFANWSTIVDDAGRSAGGVVEVGVERNAQGMIQRGEYIVRRCRSLGHITPAWLARADHTATLQTSAG